MFFQEVAIGQYLGSGGMTFVGKVCPIFAGRYILICQVNCPISRICYEKIDNFCDFLKIGTGYASMTIVFLLDVYYCIIVAWTLLYLFSCFRSLPSLPWQDCGNYTCQYFFKHFFFNNNVDTYTTSKKEIYRP